MIPYHFQSFGQGFIADDMFLAAVGSVAGVANAVSRIIWGGFGDKFGFRVRLYQCTYSHIFCEHSTRHLYLEGITVYAVKELIL